MDYLVKIRSVQTPLNGQFSIGANSSHTKDRLRLLAITYTPTHLIFGGQY